MNVSNAIEGVKQLDSSVFNSQSSFQNNDIKNKIDKEKCPRPQPLQESPAGKFVATKTVSNKSSNLSKRQKGKVEGALLKKQQPLGSTILQRGGSVLTQSIIDGSVENGPVENRASTIRLESSLKALNKNFIRLNEKVDEILQESLEVRTGVCELNYETYEYDTKRPLDAISQKFSEFIGEFDGFTEEMSGMACDIRKVIEELNTRLMHASEKKKNLLNSFVEEWNSISATSDRIRWFSDLIKALLDVLPAVRTFLSGLYLIQGEMHTQKTNKKGGFLSLEAQSKEATQSAIAAMVERFEKANAEAKKLEVKIKNFNEQVSLFVAHPEQVEEYANHTNDQKIQNQQKLNTIIDELNGTRALIRTKLLQGAWSDVCFYLNDAAVQITQFASGSSYKAFLWNTGFNDSKGEWQSLTPLPFDKALFE